MKYYIPRFNLKKLKALVNRLSKKTEVKFSCGEDHPRQARVLIDNGVYAYYWEVEVDLEINYKVGDYQLVAELEHTDEGNIIRKINQQLEVPKSYRDCKPYCEHCKTNRYRKNTFLLVDKSGGYRQVGSNCLNDYTGWDSLKIAEMCSSIALLLATPPEEDEDFMEDLENLNWFGLKETANKFYQILLAKGYDKERPFEGIETISVDKSYDAEVDKLLEVINTDWYDEESDYCNNIKVLLKMESIEYKHWRMLISYLFSAMKWLRRNDSENKWLGQVGQRIQFKCKVVSILWTNASEYYPYDPIFTYRIIEETGGVLIWKTDKEIKEGQSIKATIKYLDTYKDEKQTVVTRGSVIQ